MSDEEKTERSQEDPDHRSGTGFWGWGAAEVRDAVSRRVDSPEGWIEKYRIARSEEDLRHLREGGILEKYRGGAPGVLGQMTVLALEKNSTAMLEEAMGAQLFSHYEELGFSMIAVYTLGGNARNIYEIPGYARMGMEDVCSEEGGFDEHRAPEPVLDAAEHLGRLYGRLENGARSCAHRGLNGHHYEQGFQEGYSGENEAGFAFELGRRTAKAEEAARDGFEFITRALGGDEK
ncbi:MAG: hypothetical protein ABEJ03_01350 [Candidatus Nanohaloarchaea archaeon]